MLLPKPIALRLTQPDLLNYFAQIQHKIKVIIIIFFTQWRILQNKDFKQSHSSPFNAKNGFLFETFIFGGRVYLLFSKKSIRKNNERNIDSYFAIFS